MLGNEQKNIKANFASLFLKLWRERGRENKAFYVTLKCNKNSVKKFKSKSKQIEWNRFWNEMCLSCSQNLIWNVCVANSDLNFTTEFWLFIGKFSSLEMFFKQFLITVIIL